MINLMGSSNDDTAKQGIRYTTFVSILSCVMSPLEAPKEFQAGHPTPDNCQLVRSWLTIVQVGIVRNEKLSEQQSSGEDYPRGNYHGGSCSSTF